MSAAQHTPGPWEWDTSPVDYDPHQEAPWLVSMETAKFPDCAILTGQIKCYRQADASLIASAPELLAFVQEFVQAWDEGMAGDTALYRTAEKLIAKATGGAA